MSHDPIHDWLDMAIRKVIKGEKNAFNKYKNHQNHEKRCREQERARRRGYPYGANEYRETEQGEQGEEEEHGEIRSSFEGTFDNLSIQRPFVGRRDAHQERGDPLMSGRYRSAEPSHGFHTPDRGEDPVMSRSQTPRLSFRDPDHFNLSARSSMSRLQDQYRSRGGYDSSNEQDNSSTRGGRNMYTQDDPHRGKLPAYMNYIYLLMSILDHTHYSRTQKSHGHQSARETSTSPPT